MKFFLERVGIVGIGLLGGSIALGCKKYGIAKEVYGFGKNLEKIKEIAKKGIIDYGYSLEKTLDESILSKLDLLILATPVISIKDFLSRILKEGNPKIQKLTITDVGSTKKEICELAWNYSQGNCFVGSHPMAGKEKSGYLNSEPDLYKNATIFVCVKNNSGINKEGEENFHINKVLDFWNALGGKQELIEPSFHDFIVAQTSHLPHILSASMVAHLEKDVKLNQALFQEMRKWYGNGLLDCTRTAKGSSNMWVDILLQNTGEISKAIDSYILELKKIKEMLNGLGSKEIHSYLQNSVELRKKLK